MVKALLAGISLIFAISAQAQNEFTIKGKISGLEDSTQIVLYRSDGQVMSQIAQDTVINECFTFKGETVDNAPEALMVSSHDKGFPNTWLDVWVAPGKETTVTGNNKLIRTWNVSADIQEQHDLNWLMDAVTEYFEPPDTLGQATVPKEEQPYGAQQQLAIHLENLLILLARRYKRARKPGVRLRRERRQTALVDAARTYFAKNLERELRVDEVCEAIGCTRPQLQAAFRTRLRHTAMEEFSAMRLDYAAQLLARGDTPGEVAERMGYRSGAYFSQKFKEATGNTPSAYRRLQQGLPARRLNRQQKDKDESKTSIAETPPKK